MCFCDNVLSNHHESLINTARGDFSWNDLCSDILNLTWDKAASLFHLQINWKSVLTLNAAALSFRI